MFHPVFFLIFAGKFMTFDYSFHVILNRCTNYNSVLGFPVHGLGVEVIVFLCVLYEPTFLLKLCKLFLCAFIHTRIVFARPLRKIYFWLYNMVQRHFVVAGFLACFLRIEHIVGAAFHLFHKILGWT